MRDYAVAHKIKNPQLVILDMSHRSPYTVVLGAEEKSVNGTGKTSVFSPVLTEALEIGVHDISEGVLENMPEWISEKTLYEVPVNTNGRSYASYFVSDKKVTLSALERPALDSVDITGSITRYEGSVDVLNVRAEGGFYFDLYTIAKPHKIKCNFDEKFLEDIRSSVKQKASVTGVVTKCDEMDGFFYPSVISVQEFEQLSHKDDPPLDIDSLVDRFQTPPDVDAVKWVRKIRDEWDDE